MTTQQASSASTKDMNKYPVFSCPACDTEPSMCENCFRKSTLIGKLVFEMSRAPDATLDWQQLHAITLNTGHDVATWSVNIAGPRRIVQDLLEKCASAPGVSSTSESKDIVRWLIFFLGDEYYLATPVTGQSFRSAQSGMDDEEAMNYDYTTTHDETKAVRFSTEEASIQQVFLSKRNHPTIKILDPRMATILERLVSWGDPDLDGTPFAHPAWRRGRESALLEASEAIFRWHGIEVNTDATANEAWNAAENLIEETIYKRDYFEEER